MSRKAIFALGDVLAVVQSQALLSPRGKNGLKGLVKFTTGVDIKTSWSETGAKAGILRQYPHLWLVEEFKPKRLLRANRQLAADFVAEQKQKHNLPDTLTITALPPGQFDRTFVLDGKIFVINEFITLDLWLVKGKEVGVDMVKRDWGLGAENAVAILPKH